MLAAEVTVHHLAIILCERSPCNQASTQPSWVGEIWALQNHSSSTVFLPRLREAGGGTAKGSRRGGMNTGTQVADEEKSQL